MARSLRRISLFVVTALVAALGGGAYYFSIVLSDGLSFGKGDIAHKILVRSDTVRDFPLVEHAGDKPSFFYTARDGTNPARIDLRYASSATKDRLHQSFASHCRTKAFAVETQGLLLADASLSCDAPDYRIEVIIAPADNGTSVTVVFLEQ